MARFYQTASPEYLNDIMYQPPWEMLMAAAAKKDQDIQNAVDTLEIFNNLPVDFWKEVDTDRANQVKDYYQVKADDITSMLQNNVLDPNAQKGIRDLQRELQRDIESGNIYKLQENAKRYRQFEANRLALTNPADREMYKAVTQQYITNNPEGAYGTLFEAPELQAYRDLRNEFAEDYAKQYGEDSRKEVFDKVNGKWVAKNTDAVTQKLVNDRFQNWISSKPDLPGYFDTRQRYSPTERYYDEAGNLVFDQPGYTLYDIDKAAQDLSYTQTTIGRELTPNQFSVLAINQAHDKEMAWLNHELQKKLHDYQNQGNSPGITLPPEIPANKLLNASHTLQLKMNDALKNVLSGWTVDGKQAPIWRVAQVIMQGGREKYGAKYDEVAEIYNSIDKNYNASKKDYINLIGESETDKLFNKIETLSNTSMSLYFGGDEDGSGSVSKTKFRVNKIETANGVKVDPTQTRIVKENTLPVRLGTNNLSDDFVRYVVEFHPYEMNKDGEKVDLPIMYIPMYKEMDYFLN